MIEHYIYPEGDNPKEKFLAIQLNKKEYDSFQLKDFKELPKEKSVSYPRLVIGADRFISTFVIEDGAIQDYDFEDAVKVIAIGYQDYPTETYDISYGSHIDTIVYYCRRLNYTSLEIIYYTNSESDDPFIEYYGELLAGTQKNIEHKYNVLTSFANDPGKGNKYISIGNFTSLEDAGIEARNLQEKFPNAFVREYGQNPHRFYSVILGRAETISGAQELIEDAREKGIEDARISYV